MRFITKNGRRFPIRSKYPALTDYRYLQNQDMHRPISSIAEDHARRRLITKVRVVEKKREWGFKVGALGNCFEYKRGTSETTTKEKE